MELQITAALITEKLYMTRLLMITSILLAVTGLNSCGSGIRVQYDYIKNEDFSKYQTFDFISLPNSLGQDTRGQRLVKNAVIEELELEGFEMRFSKPDFLVAVHTSVDSRVDIQNWGYRYAPYDRYYGGYGYWGTQSFTTYTYEEGTMILDFVDPASMQLVWRGVAQGVIPRNASTDRIIEIVRAAVRRVLYYWPPE